MARGRGEQSIVPAVRKEDCIQRQLSHQARSHTMGIEFVVSVRTGRLSSSLGGACYRTHSNHCDPSPPL
eukprot:scaffold3042_cov313-Prasinococcus_capsulatus_cf.AAC.3